MIGRYGLVTSTTLYAALILFPILLYVFLYQESRIDEATMRNFRSLGTAADRIDTSLDTFRRVSKNFSLGVDSRLLNEIGRFCSSARDRWSKKNEDLRKIVDAQRKQSIRRLSSKALLINRDGQHPLPTARQPSCINAEFRAQFRPHECTAGEHLLRFGPKKLLSRDCRTLRERDDRVYSALKDGDKTGGELLIQILDRFGIEVSSDTADVFDEPTAHLSLFFDNYYIADEDGTVIFAPQPKPQPYDEHRRHRAGVPFASLATVQDLLVEGQSDPLALFHSQETDAKTAPSPTGHSVVRDIQVGDVNLSVFIHPFTTNSSTLYVVGVVLRSSLADEAIRIRLGPVPLVSF